MLFFDVAMQDQEQSVIQEQKAQVEAVEKKYFEEHEEEQALVCVFCPQVCIRSHLGREPQQRRARGVRKVNVVHGLKRKENRCPDRLQPIEL